MVGGQPGLLALAMKPDGAVRQGHLIDRAVAVEAAAEEGRDIKGVVDEGNFLVRMTLAAVFGLSIRQPSNPHGCRTSCRFSIRAGLRFARFENRDLCPFHRHCDDCTLRKRRFGPREAF